jgi:hypothetical protein
LRRRAQRQAPLRADPCRRLEFINLICGGLGVQPPVRTPGSSRIAHPTFVLSVCLSAVIWQLRIATRIREDFSSPTCLLTRVLSIVKLGTLTFCQGAHDRMSGLLEVPQLGGPYYCISVTFARKRHHSQVCLSHCAGVMVLIVLLQRYSTSSSTIDTTTDAAITTSIRFLLDIFKKIGQPSASFRRAFY